ncbi:MAG: DUF4835 family protein [Ignavibacteriales bacterium]|nr:DUF4835 family protein [Ignavibacteriales bacterium]
MKKFILAFLFLPGFLISQELDATVTTNVEKLSIGSKDRIINFSEDIQNYLNNTRFSGDAWNFDKIKCSFNIFFSGSSDETHYSAQINITSLRPVEKSGSPTIMLNVIDNTWEFQYQSGQSMYFSPDYDPLTDFLDYYAFLIIGLNEDSFTELGGSQYFTQAYNQAVFDASYSSSAGWETKGNSYNRRGLIEDLVSEKYRPFREDCFNYHYNGLDIFTTKKEEAVQNIVKLIKNLETLKAKVDIGGVLIKTFFDAKSSEIVNYLKDYPDKMIFKSLKKIDPPHTQKYDEAMLNE